MRYVPVLGTVQVWMAPVGNTVLAPLQTPVTHVLPWQTLPQAPQFASSDCSFAQYGTPPSAPASPPQSVLPGAQVAPHAPPEQTWPAEQACPHVPQLALSVASLAQYAAPPSGEQSVLGATQAVTQAPPAQAWPAAQVCPHAPQLTLSVSTFAQYALPPSVPASAPQSVSLDAQLVPHVPAEQTWPARHALPQAPQFCSSLVVFEQKLPPSDVQTVWPGAHWTLQVPVSQTSPAPHAVAQPPQWDGSTFVSAQLCPHCVVPPPQLVVHAPCEQTSPAEHAFPQLPQFAGSLALVEQASPHIVWLAGHVAAASACVASDWAASDCAASGSLDPGDPVLEPQPCITGAATRNVPTRSETAVGHAAPRRVTSIDMCWQPPFVHRPAPIGPESLRDENLHCRR
jgi:hypothetical protein